MIKFQILLILFTSFSLSKTHDHELALMITEKVASQAAGNLTEMGHSTHFISEAVKEFKSTAPGIISEELIAMKYELENSNSSISKRKLTDWFKRRAISRIAKRHAHKATSRLSQQLKSSFQDKKSLSKRFFETTLTTILTGTAAAGFMIIAAILLFNLIIFFGDICSRFVRFGMWGSDPYMSGVGFGGGPGYGGPGYGGPGFGGPGYGGFGY